MFICVVGGVLNTTGAVCPGETLAEGGDQISARGETQVVQKLKLMKGSRSVARAFNSPHIPSPRQPLGNSLGALSQFGSRKLHFALTQKGREKSRGWNLFLTWLPGLPTPTPVPVNSSLITCGSPGDGAGGGPVGCGALFISFGATSGSPSKFVGKE